MKKLILLALKSIWFINSFLAQIGHIPNATESNYYSVSQRDLASELHVFRANKISVPGFEAKYMYRECVDNEVKLGFSYSIYLLQEITFPMGYGYSGQPENDEAIIAERYFYKAKKTCRIRPCSESQSAMISNPNKSKVLFELAKNSDWKFWPTALPQSEWFDLYKYSGWSYASSDGLAGLKFSWGLSPRMTNNQSKNYFHTDGYDNARENLVMLLDSSERIVKMKLGNQSSIQYEYSEGRITEASYLGAKTAKFEYSYFDNGLLAKRLDFYGNSSFPSASREYKYDSYGNIVSITHTGVDDGQSRINFRYEYDEFNRWIEATILLPTTRNNPGNRYSVMASDVCPPNEFIWDGIYSRQIRYSGDTRTLLPYLTVDDGEIDAASPAKANSSIPQWFKNVESISESFGSRLLVNAGQTEPCLGQSARIDDYLQLISVQVGKYFDILNRNALQIILEEQKLGLSGIVNAGEQVLAGEISGAEKTLLLEIGCIDLRQTINIQCIDIQTSKIDWSLMSIGATFDEFLEELLKELNEN